PVPIRRDEIFRLISEKGAIKVTELSEQLGVTNMTIRRDLESLEKEGIIERTHGGAIAANRRVQEPLFYQKMRYHNTEKDAIAKVVTSLIEDNDTIFLNSGTTTLRIFTRILAKNVKLVTNNAYFPTLTLPDHIEVISTGGVFRKESFTYIGDGALQSISRVYATKSFLGVDGFDVEFGITTPVQPEAQINRTMIEHTQGPVYIVADSSKLAKVSHFFVAPVHVVYALITDVGITKEQKTAFEEAGIKVIIG
ncbi:MAG: DeoR/GlpR transcriptional regulator, partial [Spirochaetia bacterium]|nr:DeoR/GlpR transcriptional regulator [Spirochaetia bacterium]